MEKMGNSGFADMLTPLTEGPKGKELGFPVNNTPQMSPKDPLGIIPGGNKAKSGKKDKKGIGDRA